MSNSSRSSRHASGILPARHFFNLRKPIRAPTTTFSLRPKSPASSSSSNDTSTSSQPTTYSSSQTRLPFTSVVRSSLSTISSEGKNPSKSSKQPSIAMTTLPSARDTTPNPSVDSILASTSATTDDNTSPNRPPSALLTRRQQRSPGSVEDMPQIVIDSVLEPRPSSLSILEPAVTTVKSSSSTSGYPAELIRHPVIHRSLSQKKLPPIPSPTSQDSSTTHNSFLAIPYNSTRPMSRITFHPPPISSVGSKGRKRVYQVWPGRNKFFLGGRIITSRDFPAFLVAVTTLVVPCGLFFGFTAPFLYTHLSPAVVFIFIYLFLLSLTSMLITSWTDPGIVSRNLDPSPPTEEFDESDNFFNQSQYPYYPPRIFPLQKDIKINGQATRLKYCDTCKIYRPPRCSHCRQCDNCVENEDHHCIWLNNCIGRRNYRSFFTFIVTATVICVYIFSFCTAHIILLMKERDISFGRALGAAPISFVLVVVALFLVWSVGGLTGYHIYLISNNMTTHEQLRTPLPLSDYQNPFDFGKHHYNCFWVLCRPLVRSYINRRGFVETEEGGGGLNEGTSSVSQIASQQLQMTSTSTAIDINTIAGPSSRGQQNAVNV